MMKNDENKPEDNMRIIITLIFLASLMIFSANLAAQNFDHAIFDELLQKYVANGLVDYQGLKAEHES